MTVCYDRTLVLKAELIQVKAEANEIITLLEVMPCSKLGRRLALLDLGDVAARELAIKRQLDAWQQ